MTVTPVICVGLGGTGRDVLVRVRQIIVEQFGSLAEMPIVSFVQIDTDRGGRILNYRGQSIEFSPAEEVHLSVSLNTVNEFKSNYERRQKNGGNTPDDNILEWFPDQLVRNLNTIEHGAGAVRAVGRFALFKNYAQIVQALNEAHGRVAGADLSALIERGIEVRPGLRVFVAASLCGGTGSGTFLDIGYILRRLFAGIVANFETHAYLVISPDLYGGNDVVKSNCYAGLKELDYYTRKGTTFDAQYPGERRLSESRPPYDYIYLISNSTPNGKFIIPAGDPNAKGKITNMIAQKICLFLTSNATASAAISARDNLRAIDATEEHDRHPRPNRQRYMATGLASIYFPQDKINQLAANQVKIQLLEFWKSGLGQAPTSTQLQQLYSSQFEWDTEDLGQVLRRRLEKLMVQGETLLAKIERWRNDQYSQINATRSRDDQDRLRIEIPRRCDDLLNFMRPGETNKERGVWLTALIEQTPDVVCDIKDSIDDFLKKILQPDHQYFGLENALNWLQSLKVKLEHVRLEQADNRLQNVETKRQEIINQMQNEIQAIQGRWWPVGKLNQTRQVFRTAVDRIADFAKRIYQSQVDRQVRAATEQLIEFSGRKIASLVQLRDFLHENIQQLEQREKRLSELNIQERIGLPIIRPEDTQNAIHAFLPPRESERRLELNQLSVEVIRRAVTVSTDTPSSLWCFLEPQFAPDEIPKALDQVVDGRIPRVTSTLQGSAVKRFMEMGTREQLIDYLEMLRNHSDILLPLNFSDGYFSNTPNKRTMFIAYHQPVGDDPYVHAFTELLNQTGMLANAQRVLLPASEQHQVIFMTEYAGFPLRLINDLTAKNFQYAYERRAEARNFDHLHTNKSKNVKFTDILPPPPDVVERVQELFFKCLALDVFEMDGDDLFVRNDRGNLIPLGHDWAAIIDQMSWAEINLKERDETSLIDRLRQELDCRIESLLEHPTDWYSEQGRRRKIEDMISRIRAYSADHINYAMVPIVAGTEITDVAGRARKGILERLIEDIDKRFRQKQVSVKTLPGQEFTDSPSNSP
ncbi:MAG: hypothetical protein NZ821_02265 [Gloeomargarita sp. SKYB31]|nr:hypothetical protein [Gloeomargarita sp. SKYB31]